MQVGKKKKKKKETGAVKQQSDRTYSGDRNTISEIMLPEKQSKEKQKIHPSVREHAYSAAVRSVECMPRMEKKRKERNEAIQVSRR